MMDRPINTPLPRLASPRRRRRTAARPWLLVASATAAAVLVTPAAARDIKYCSNLNTSDNSAAFTDNFQSNGLCYDHCKADYAFAIVQGKGCWCSNYVPDVTTSGCNDPCPGYPDDTCGNSDQNLYGYMALPNKPSGTKSLDSTTSVQTTVDTSKASPKTTKPTATTATAGSVVVTTVPGGFQTVTISSGSTGVPKPTPAAAPAKDGDFFSNAGRAAALIVGLVLALILIVAGVLFCRRRQNMRRSAVYTPGSTAGVISAGGAGFFGNARRGRSMSTLGLVGEKCAADSTTPPDQAPAAAAAAGSHAAGATAPEGGGEIYDPRLDPGSLFMRFDHQTGSSRMSVRSLRDDQDYSRRVLRLANPDEH